MPEFDPAPWRSLFARLDDVWALPADQRGQAVEAIAAGQRDALAAALRGWQADSVTPDAAVSGAPLAALAQNVLAACAAVAGQRFGNYRLIEPIARGGMGSVWRAERTDGLYRGEVAVKLLGTLALSAQARARFAREGELLARLSHPHIARLLDAGLTSDHQRFLVLELVRGEDIASFVEHHRLAVRDVLALFRQLLAAIAFAHGQLVVHRDIKPGNVLVTHDRQVRLLDFGVAKLLGDDADDDLTRAIGAAYTEAYAAPEQLRGDVTGTAADVFSLGCLLYRLLVGESPQWASARRELRTDSDDVSGNARWLALPTDLRGVIRKALAADPSDRYATAAAFDDDIARFLDGAPVRAQPATRWYRARKFVQRHRLPVAIAGAAFAAVVASLAFALWELAEARAQRAQALSEANRANQVTAFVTGLFRASDPRLASMQDKSKLTAQQLLQAGTERLQTDLNDQPETRIALLGLLAEIWGYLGDDARFTQLNNERIRFARSRFGPLHSAVIDGMLTDADADLYSGHFDRARQTLTSVEPVLRQVFGDKSERYAAWLATAAELERRAGGPAATASVLPRFERSLALYRALGIENEGAAIALQNYSTALREAGRLDEALAANHRAIALFEHDRNSDQGNLGAAHVRRAELLHALNRDGEVEAAYDRALTIVAASYGATSALYLNDALSKARWLHTQGRRDEAWTLWRKVAAAPRRASSDNYGSAELHYQGGLMWLDEGRRAQAMSELALAADEWRKAGTNPTRLATAEQALTKAQALVTPGGSTSSRRP